MTACFISVQKEEGSLEKIGVYHTQDGVKRVNLSQNMADWTGDPETLEDCVAATCNPVTESCSIDPQTLVGPVSTGGGTAPISLSARELECGQKGNFVANGASLLSVSDYVDGSTFPMTLTAPAAAAGSVLALHVSWGSAHTSGINGWFNNLQVVKDLGSELSDPVVIGYDEYWEYGATVRPMMGNAIYLFDVASSGAGTTVILDMLNNELGNDGNGGADPKDGAISWHWVEITSNDPNHAVDKFELKGEYGVVNNNNTTGNFADIAIDAGECDAFHFAMHRHAMGEPPYQFVDEQTDYFDGCYQGIWNDNNAAIDGYDQLYANVTFNATSSPCQVGSSAGFIEGGSGPITFNHIGNNVGTNGREFGGGHVIGLIECAEIEAPPEEQTKDFDTCVLEIENTTDCEGTKTCSYSIEGEVVLDADESVSIVPVIDGTAMEAERIDVSSSQPFSFSISIAGVPSAANSAPVSTEAFVRVDFVGEGEVSLNNGELSCQINPN